MLFLRRGNPSFLWNKILDSLWNFFFMKSVIKLFFGNINNAHIFFVLKMKNSSDRARSLKAQIGPKHENVRVPCVFKNNTHFLDFHKKEKK